MAYQYPNISKREDGTYGPTAEQHFYRPAPYHNPTAKKSSVKSRWRLIEPEQYEVFRVADEASDTYQDARGGLYGFLDEMKEILGKDNEERIAYFPHTATNQWHGYPTNSRDIDDSLIEKWNTKGVINNRVYRLLLKHSI